MFACITRRNAMAAQSQADRISLLPLSPWSRFQRTNSIGARLSPFTELLIQSSPHQLCRIPDSSSPTFRSVICDCDCLPHSMSEPKQAISKTSPTTNRLSESGTLSNRESKNVKHQSSHDRLSDLPLSVINVILARVTTREAIRTCVLSKQWRYTWTTLPRLLFHDFDDVYRWTSAPNDQQKAFGETTNKFITRLLHLHKGPISTFEISYPCDFGIPNVEEWTHCLSRNGISELVMQIMYEPGQVSALHSSLYSCTNLTKLELWNVTIDPPPSTFKGFLLLRSLHFYRVFVSHVVIESLFVNSPLLERLAIVDCQSSDEIHINAPNLKYLFLGDDYIEFFLYTPQLTELSMELFSNDFAPKNQTTICNYANFFGGSTNLVKLIGSLCFTKFLSIGIEFCHHTLVFNQLKAIDLSDVNFGDTKEIAAVARLVIGAPNLQKLEISDDTDRNKSEAPDPSFEDFNWPSSFTFDKLRIVSMPGICSNLLGMQLVKFLLENSPVLETMDLGHIDHPYRRVTAELLGFTRASPKAKIVLT